MVARVLRDSSDPNSTLNLGSYVINWKSKCNIAEKENLTKIKMRQFQQQQLEQFDALLANYNWSSVFTTSGIDRKVNTFLQITENMISVYFPEKTARIYSKDNLL